MISYILNFFSSSDAVPDDISVDYIAKQIPSISKDPASLFDLCGDNDVITRQLIYCDPSTGQNVISVIIDKGSDAQFDQIAPHINTTVLEMFILMTPLFTCEFSRIDRLLDVVMTLDSSYTISQFLARCHSKRVFDALTDTERFGERGLDLVAAHIKPAIHRSTTDCGFRAIGEQRVLKLLQVRDSPELRERISKSSLSADFKRRNGIAVSAYDMQEMCSGTNVRAETIDTLAADFVGLDAARRETALSNLINNCFISEDILERVTATLVTVDTPLATIKLAKSRRTTPAARAAVARILTDPSFKKIVAADEVLRVFMLEQAGFNLEAAIEKIADRE